MLPTHFAGEPLMKNRANSPKGWMKPAIRLLGKIKDVAGAQGAGGQAAGLKT